jgi:hypothetical protein
MESTDGAAECARELAQSDANDALSRSYVCAVVDPEQYLVLRADLLAGAVGRPESTIFENSTDGGSAPIFVPLMRTGFSRRVRPVTGLFSVREYLDKYPEMLTKDADVVIESTSSTGTRRPTSQPTSNQSLVRPYADSQRSIRARILEY